MRERVVAVIAHFNGGMAAIPALEALLTQSQPIEGIVVVDDAGDPRKLAELETWLATRPAGPWHVILRKASNQGPAAAFRDGIKEAVRRGAQYAWLCDQDMRPTPDCLRHLVDGLRHLPEASASTPRRVNPATGVVYRQYRVSGTGLRRVPQERQPFRGICVFSGLLLRNPLASVALLPSDYHIDGDDFAFTWRLSTEQGPILYVPEALAQHECGIASRRRFLIKRVTVVLSPTWRLYYRTRNQWRFSREAMPSNMRAAIFFARTFLPVAAAHVLYKADRTAVVRNLWAGCRDARRGVRGRRPERTDADVHT